MKAIGGFFTSVGDFLTHEIRSEINPNYTLKEKKKKTIPQKKMTIQEIFIEAIKKDNVDKVTSLINRVDVNAKDATGLRPIQHAVMGGDRNRIKIVELLLDNGARIDTDLFTLAIKKQYDTRIIALLFERGIPLDFKNSKQKGWMHLAAKRGSIPMINVLLQHGLSCSDRSATGATPLHLAAKKGDATACEILLKNVDIETRDNIGLTSLQYAFRKKNKKKDECIGKYAAFKLIKNGANVNVSDENGCTPLFIAASKGEKQLVEELIASGASLDTPNNMRETPLHIAVKNGQKLIALLLIKHGATFSEEIQWLSKRKGWNLLEDINTNIETLNDNLVIEEVHDAFVKAQSLINSSEFKEAKIIIKETLEQLKKKYDANEHPLVISLYHQLAFIHFQLKKPHDAKDYFKKIVKILEDAQSSIEEKGKDLASYYLMLAYYCQVIDSNNSEGYIKKAKSEVGKSHLEDSAVLGSHYGNLGILYYNSLNMSEAIFWLKKALSNKSSSKFESILKEAKKFEDYRMRFFKIKPHKDFFREGCGDVLFETRRITAINKDSDEEEDYGTTSTGQRVVFVARTTTKKVYDNDEGYSEDTTIGRWNRDFSRFW